MRTLKQAQIKETNRKTMKNTNIHGKIVEKKEGWIVLQIYGDAFHRGFAHGYLLHKELKRTKDVLLFFIKQELGISVSKYMKIVKTKIQPVMKKRYIEFYEEISGISKGAKTAGTDISVDIILAWNSYITIYSYLKDGAPKKCSAFIATGNATEKGDIVMAHTTHTNFADGQLANIILYVFPSSGFSFVMQTQPGLIASGMDWFLCSSGIVGCETTISDIKYKPRFEDPFFCRIRKCMQYGGSFDDYEKIMTTRNGGDYACSWLLGNINTNEIMLFELGLLEKNVTKTKNGAFYGMNVALGRNIREKETADKDLNNRETSSGNRNLRFNDLLFHDYQGKINIENSKKIISDHYDTSLQGFRRNTRGICKHDEFDETLSGNPNFMCGSTDAKVVNTDMAKHLVFQGRFGSGCGRTFTIEDHLKKYPEYEEWRTVVEDIPLYKWTTIQP